jgi:hypothetical protein
MAVTLAAGGLASVLLTALLVKFKVGLKPIDPALAASLQAAVAAAAADVDASDSAQPPLTPRRKSQRSVIYARDGLNRRSDTSVSYTWVLLDEDHNNHPLCH